MFQNNRFWRRTIFSIITFKITIIIIFFISSIVENSIDPQMNLSLHIIFVLEKLHQNVNKKVIIPYL
jgi:hypothetical protein